MRAAQERGWRVLLLTSLDLKNEPWPHDALANIFYLDQDTEHWDLGDTLKGVSYLAQTEAITHIVGLDDFDQEKAASLREHLRLPGMGASGVRLVRDKLAMRQAAETAGLPQPRFCKTFPHSALHAFTQEVAPPWILKPRSEASADGVQRIDSAEELWRALEALGDRQAHHLVEDYIPGTVYHADAIVRGGALQFCTVSAYRRPPMNVVSEGGVFATQTLPPTHPDALVLAERTSALLQAVGHADGVCHAEFIRADDGTFNFLEVASRVGGAHIAEMVEEATGVNLWREWARVATLADGEEYAVEPTRALHAGLLVALCKHERPDYACFDAPEVAWRMDKAHHVGLIVACEDRGRVNALLDEYAARIARDFAA